MVTNVRPLPNAEALIRAALAAAAVQDRLRANDRSLLDQRKPG